MRGYRKNECVVREKEKGMLQRKQRQRVDGDERLQKVRRDL